MPKSLSPLFHGEWWAEKNKSIQVRFAIVILYSNIQYYGLPAFTEQKWQKLCVHARVT